MKNLIVVRGGGDLATGTIYKLHQCGFPVLVLEIAAPSAIRRNVAFSEAVYQGTQQVENVTCYTYIYLEEAVRLLENGELPLLVDPEGKSIEALKPMAVVDAILAKRNLGTHKEMAPITVALGPGFTAGWTWMPWWKPSVVTTWDGCCGRELPPRTPAFPVSLRVMARNG